jgi:hypothetical protein
MGGTAWSQPLLWLLPRSLTKHEKSEVRGQRSEVSSPAIGGSSHPHLPPTLRYGAAGNPLNAPPGRDPRDEADRLSRLLSMKFLAYFRSLAARFFHRSQTENDMEEELRSHMKLMTNDQ